MHNVQKCNTCTIITELTTNSMDLMGCILLCVEIRILYIAVNTTLHLP
jgi:hypothetical protein